MTSYLSSNIKKTHKTQEEMQTNDHSLQAAGHRSRILDYGSQALRKRPYLPLLIIPFFYLLTVAHTPVLGDPTEYTVVAHTLGVAHPPGYAFITVVGKLFQTIVPFGAISWRMHLLSAVSGTIAVFFVYGIMRTVTAVSQATNHTLSILAALFAALTVGTAVNQWQHSIHANPHIITAAFLAANLYFLTRWWHEQRTAQGTECNGWLYIFSLSAGLGVTHHPLTVFGFPAYTLFILAVWWQHRKRLFAASLRQRNRLPLLADLRSLLMILLKMLGFALLGLAVWLYFPLRSPGAPLGATGLNTLDGFLNHVLARGLSETLPFYRLSDQPTRLIVFYSILRLQYSLVTIFLAAIGVFFPLFSRHTRAATVRLPIFLYLFTFLSFYVFVISLRVQDIMAYLLGPLLLIGLFAGLGFWQMLTLLHDRSRVDKRALALLATAVFLLGPALQILRNAPGISLSQYNEGQDYVDAVFDHFASKGAGATLLNDWEHMTPLWYSKFVNERWPDPADIQVQWVSAGTVNPWLEAVFQYLPGGPVYLSNYRREIVDAGFRLRPFGPFYQVVEPGNPSLPPELTPVRAVGEEIEVVGLGLGETAVTAGDYLPLALAMSAPITPTHYYVPIITVGNTTSPRIITYTFTTDSHLLTPWWLPDEVVVERFDLALPLDLPAGSYPISLALENLSTDQRIPLNLTLSTLTVTAQRHPLRTNTLLANFRQRVGLVSATASKGFTDRRNAPWDAPITARPGEIIDLTLHWQCLNYATESYTIFVHLIDLANQPFVTLDYTPLGGSVPTHLWFPKWLPGQQFIDPYHLQIPPDLPPGQYLIEVGLYEMVGKRRLHIADTNGNLVGDRYILGSVIVDE